MAELSTAPAAARVAPIGAGALVAVGLAAPASRFSFRGSSEAAAACGLAFGCTLTEDVCRAVEQGDRAALWLGPDEWLLLAPESKASVSFQAIETALGAMPHALVDISHRQVGFEIAGGAAALVLNSGCPLDLSLVSFPVGMSTRTVLAKSDIVLWRQAPDRFRLEVNRSFANYVAGYLRMAERGAA